MKSVFKTSVAVLCAVFVMALAGCQKEPEDLIVGSWTEYEAVYTATQNGETVSFPMFEEGETMAWSFDKDGTYKSVYHSVDGDVSESGTWSISGTKLTLVAVVYVISDGPQVFNIDSIDKKSMVLSWTESGEDEDGPYTAGVVMRFSRNK